MAVRKLSSWPVALLVLLVVASTSRAQIPVPTDVNDYVMNSEGMYVQDPSSADIINGDYVGYYAPGGNYNGYGGGFVEFANPDGGSFGGQNWGGLAFAGVTLQDNQLVDGDYSGYLFQPAPGANDYALIGALGTSATNDGGPSDNDALAGASVQDIENMYGPQSGSYVYPGTFSQATSYTVDMGTNTVAVLDVEAGLRPGDTGGFTEASPNLNLSGTFTARGEALIAGDDSEPVTISGSSGGSFYTPFLDLYGQVDVTGGKVSGDFLLIDNDIDPNVYSAGNYLPSTQTTVDVSGAGASLVSSQSLLIGRSSDAPATLIIENGASGTFNNVDVGCGTADSNGTLKIDNGTVSISGFLEVGAGGSGTLLVQNGATLMTGTGQSDTDTGAYINGANADDGSSATIDGEGTKWVNTGNLSIGYYANGPSSLTISNGADVQVTGELILGTESGADASVVIENGGTFETGVDISDGSGDSGTSGDSADAVHSNALAASANSSTLVPLDDSGNPAEIVGDAAGSSGFLTITNSNTKYTAGALLIDGYQGEGNIIVQNGATLVGDLIAIGYNGIGSMTVTGNPSAIGPNSGSGSTFTFSNRVFIGENAAGTLTVNQGSQVTYNGSATNADGIELGENQGSSGTVMLTDAGSSITTPILLIADSGSGEFTVQNMATLTSTLTGLGYSQGGNGTLTVDGGGQSGTSASLGDAAVGLNGSGLLTIKDAATVTATALRVAVGSNAPKSIDANGSIVLTGTNATLTVSGDADVGDGTNNYGVISLSSGSFFTANNVTLGPNGGYGRLTLQGGGSTATINGDLNVDADTSSNVAVNVGASSTLTDAGNVSINVPDGLNKNLADALVSGSGALWSISGNLMVGQTTNGEFDVQAGGHADVTGNVLIGQSAGSFGRIHVSGSGSQLTVGGTTTVGATGALAAALIFDDGSRSDFTGTVDVANGAFNVGSNLDSNGAGTFVQTRELDVGGGSGSASVSVTNGANLDADGLVDIEANGTVEINGSLEEPDNPGGVEASLNAQSVNIGSQGTLTVRAGGTVGIVGQFTIQNGAALRITPGSVITAQGGVYLAKGVNVQVGGGEILYGGALTGGGTINGNVLSAGTVAPGDPQTLTINGNYTQMAGGFLILDVDGNVAGDYDQLDVTGKLSIESDATLALAFGNGFAPIIGETFNLVDYGTLDPLNASFTDVDITGLAPGFEYLITPVGTDGTDFQLTALNNGVATTTPEPSTWVLLLAGLSLLGFVGSKRFKEKQPALIRIRLQKMEWNFSR